MSSARWDPWGEMFALREAMTSLLEESIVRQQVLGAAGVLGLTVDLRETAEEFLLTASVPGVRPEDVEITVIGDTVRIAGERQQESGNTAGADGGRWLIRERHFGPFDRTLKLTTVVDADAASARFDDGVLTIVLPKAEQAKPKTIHVRAQERNSPIEIGSSESG